MREHISLPNYRIENQASLNQRKNKWKVYKFVVDKEKAKLDKIAWPFIQDGSKNRLRFPSNCLSASFSFIYP